jgi:hypothetical protein
LVFDGKERKVVFTLEGAFTRDLIQEEALGKVNMGIKRPNIPY